MEKKLGEKWGGTPILSHFSPILAILKNFTSVLIFLGGQKNFFLPPRKVKTLVKIFRIAKIGEKWLSMGVPPHFSPKIFFPK